MSFAERADGALLQPFVTSARWPSPLVRMYLGEISPDAAAETATGPRKLAALARRCAVHLMAGHLHLARGERDSAARMFERGMAEHEAFIDAGGGNEIAVSCESDDAAALLLQWRERGNQRHGGFERQIAGFGESVAGKHRRL